MNFFISDSLNEKGKGQLFFCKVHNNYMTMYNSWSSSEDIDGYDEAQVTKQLSGEWYNNPIVRPELWNEIDLECFTKLKADFDLIFEE